MPVVDDTGDVLRRVLRIAAGVRYEAAWRPVDVRCLSTPNVLIPEKLALLCLRCWIDRTA